MSDLRPIKRLFSFGEEKFWLLFSIKTVDEIQSELNLPIFDAVDVLMKAARKDTDEKTIRDYAGILTAVINSNGKKKVSIQEVIEYLNAENYVVTALRLVELFWNSMPEADDYDPDDEEETDKQEKEAEKSINVANIVYIGCAVLGYREREVFEMTLRKFYLLYDQHLIAKGLKKEENIDEEDMFRD